MIKGVKFVSIASSDQQRALEFWTKQVGFVVHTDQPFNEKQRWIELRIKGAETNVVLFTPDEHAGRVGGFSNLSFWTDDVEKTYEEMKARGVEFVQPPKKADWGTAALFKDPDGTVYVMGTR